MPYIQYLHTSAEVNDVLVIVSEVDMAARNLWDGIVQRQC